MDYMHLSASAIAELQAQRLEIIEDINDRVEIHGDRGSDALKSMKALVKAIVAILWETT